MNKPFVYMIGYLALMIPTYVLPYMGSNSLIANSIGAAVGRGLTPQWWLHAWSLVMLILLAYMRGKWISKNFLMVFPLVAAVFDMTPGLSVIPLVPTVMHLFGIVLGATGKVANLAEQGEGEIQVAPSASVPTGIAALMTIAAVIGSIWFARNLTPPRVTKPTAAISDPAVPVVPKPTAGVKPGELPTAQKSSVQTGAKLQDKSVATKPVPRKTAEVTPGVPKPVAEPAPAPKVRYINLND